MNMVNKNFIDILKTNVILYVSKIEFLWTGRSISHKLNDVNQLHFYFWLQDHISWYHVEMESAEV
jgi:hypothetical protein